MGIFLSGVASQDWQGHAEEWMNSGYNDAGYQQQYYPYFGEDFFSSDPGDHSQQAIEAQRQKFEAPSCPTSGTGSYSTPATTASRDRGAEAEL